jgi:hypothetical protein
VISNTEVLAFIEPFQLDQNFEFWILNSPFWVRFDFNFLMIF